jgi:hypothetical protein
VSLQSTARLLALKKHVFGLRCVRDAGADVSGIDPHAWSEHVFSAEEEMVELPTARVVME